MTASKKSQSNSADVTSDSINTDMRFEQAVAELEAIVNQMELGNLPLEESFNAYKRGAALVQICQASLNNVEQQVRILTDANKLATFNPDNE